MSVRALSYHSIKVRVSLSHERPIEAERELTGMAGFSPFRRGGEKVWEFSSREWADLFANQARYVPGVSHVDVGVGWT